VVERAEEQHGVEDSLSGPEVSSVATRCAHRSQAALGSDLLGAFDVECDRVDDVNGVAALAQRDGVHACATANVEHPGRWWWKQPVQELQGPEVFQPGMTVDEQARLLQAEVIVRLHLRINHRPIIAHHRRIPECVPPIRRDLRPRRRHRA